ncbi:MAG TPA: TMEM175 family protein [Ktedonobacterales bacterium]|jgi:uncharacterized membrane protein|nr:TMEM175 family protein [Ktedonobacterales bacterium]
MWHFDSERRAAAHGEQLAEPSIGQERRETGRLEALSDGVFAIAMTLLILSIPIPTSDALSAHHESLRTAVLAGRHWLPFVTYVMSFVTVLVMWINHHYLFQFLGRVDRVFVIANGMLLLLVVFVNYPTALVANFIGVNTSDGEFAAIAYNVTFVLVAICYNAMWLRISIHRRLLAADVDDAEVSTFTRQYLLGGPLYLAALLLAFVNPGLSIALDAALAIYWAFTGRIVRTKRRYPAHHPAQATSDPAASRAER